jgi:glycosyltransferase involved in cell wall biosynthesis
VKIAEIIATFPPHHGGMGYVCYYNARELARHGHEVTVFTLDYGSTDYKGDPEYFKVVRLKTPLIHGDAGMIPQLYSRLKEFDIIHLHYPFFGGAEYVYLASLLRKQPYFLTYHMDVYGTSFLKKLIIRAYEPLLMRRIISRAALIAAVSKEHLRSSKVARFVDWDKVVEMPNGVDVEIFSPREKNTDLVTKHNLLDKTVVLFVGNLLPLKGIDLLIEAISRVKDDHIVLIIIGGGYAETQYKHQVQEKGLQHRVIFAGPQSHSKYLPYYYNLCDFLVLPSTQSESFGLVVLEAMASGKPAVISSLPGPSMLIENGKDGLIVEVGDIEDLRNKIEFLAAHKDLCQMMGRAGREKVLRRYSWDKAGDQLDRTFRRLLDKETSVFARQVIDSSHAIALKKGEEPPAAGTLPVLSIIIPVYNSEKTIGRTLDSLKRMADTSKGLTEVIVIDDGSLDKSIEIIESTKSELQPLSLIIVRQENQGTAVARNTGLKQSTGTWIFFLDADDELAFDPLQLLRKSPDASALGFSVKFYKEMKLRKTLRPVLATLKNHLNVFSSRNAFTASSIIFKKNRIQSPFDPAFLYLEDWLFWIMNPSIFEDMKLFRDQVSAIIHSHGKNKSSDYVTHGKYRKKVADAILEKFGKKLTQKQKNNLMIQAQIGLIQQGKRIALKTFFRFPSSIVLYGKLITFSLFRRKFAKIDFYGR